VLDMMRTTKGQVAQGVALIVLMFGLAVTAIAPAEAAVNPKSAKYFEQGQKYATGNNIPAAIIEYKNAVREDPNNLDARFELARLYLQTLDGPSAEKELKAAQDRGYDVAKTTHPLAEAYYLQAKHSHILDELRLDMVGEEDRTPLAMFRAQAAFALGKPDLAETEISAVQGDESIPEVLIIHSWILQSKGDFDGAEQKADEALQLDSSNLQALLQKGNLMRARRQYEEAIPYFDQIVEAEPLNLKARIGRADVNRSLANYQAVLDDVEVILERRPGEANASYLKAFVLAKNNSTAEALDILAEARRIDLIPAAMYLSAALHYSSGQLEQARAAINKYLTTAPYSEDGLALSAVIHMKAGESARAVDILERLHDDSPDNLNATILLASAYNQLKEYAKASELYDLALQTETQNEDLRFRAAQSKLSQGATDEVLADLADLAFANDGSERASDLLFLTHLRSRDYEAAESNIDQIENVIGVSAKTENYRATIAMSRGRLNNASNHLQRALKLDPNFLAAGLNLARLHAQRGDEDLARSQYQDILRREENYAPALLGLAELAERRGDLEEEGKILDTAVKKSPTSARAHSRRIENLLQQGKVDRALLASRDFKQALPDAPEALDALARVHLANGQFTSAVVTYQKLAAKLPENAIAQQRLANALTKIEDYDGAKKALDRAMEIEPRADTARQLRIMLEKEISGVPQAEELARTLYGQIDDPLKGLIGLGGMLMALGNEQEGLRTLRQAYQSTGERGGLLALYRALNRSGRPEEAEDAVRLWLSDHEDDHAIRFILFSGLITSGRIDEAIIEGEILYQKTSSDPIVLNNLAWLYDHTGRHEEAIALARHALEVAPESGEIIDTLGWILFNQGQISEAKTLLADAAKRMPRGFDIQYHHAKALASTGKPKEALAILNHILEASAPFSERAAAKELQSELSK